MGEKDASNQIFRQEVIDKKNNRWLGDALLISEVPSYVLGLGATFIILIFFAFIIFGQFTRRVSVTGEVTSLPHPINILSPQQGAILDSYTHAGQHVKKGDPLFKLDVSRNSNAGNVSQNAMRVIESQLTDIQSIMTKLEHNKNSTLVNLKSQLEKYKAANQHSIKRYVDAQSGLHNMRKIADDYAQYLKQGLVNREQVNNLHYLYYERQNTIENLNTQVLQQTIQISDIEKEISTRAADFEQQILNYQVQYSDLVRQQSDVNATDVLMIKAQQSGFVENMIVSQGQMVNAGDSLVQLSPDNRSQFSIILWLPNNSIPYINRGDQVNLRYHAFPYEKFGQFAGKISEISRVPASNNELQRYSSSPKNSDASYYKVSIQPLKNQVDWKGEAFVLTSGMKTDATFFLEKRPIYQWIFAPFYDISKSVDGAIHE